MELYNDALKNSDSHTKSMLALAKQYLADGNLDACQQQVGDGKQAYSCRVRQVSAWSDRR